MQIQIQEKEPCKVQVSYIADPAKVLAKRAEVADKVFEDTAKLVVPGYRKGKAPFEAVKLRFRKNIEEQTKQKMLVLAEEEILFETKMKTLFSTQVVNASLQDSKFECELLFCKKPIVELKEYKGLKIPKPHLPKSLPELTEQMLQELRVKYGDVVPFAENDVSEIGDKITMDVKCLAEGKSVDELTKHGIFYTVGQGFYHEFDNNILGMRAGEEKTFEVLWDSQTKEKATFIVKIHMGVKTLPATLDDSFATKLGLDSFEKLRAEVASAAEKKIGEYEKNSIHSQIIAQLMATHQIDVPAWLIDLDAQQLAMQHGLKWKEVAEESKKALEEKALDRLKLTLIMDAIRETESETQFSNNEMFDLIRSRVAQQGQDPDKFVADLQQSGRLFGVIAALQQEATLEWLAKQAILVE